MGRDRRLVGCIGGGAKLFPARFPFWGPHGAGSGPSGPGAEPATCSPLARSAAAAVWAIPHLQLWLLPSLPLGAASLLLAGAAVGACCCVALLVSPWCVWAGLPPSAELGARA
jgi:hypothetical protein